MDDDLIILMYFLYAVVASIIFFFYIKKIFHECATFVPISEEEFKKFYKKELFKGFVAIALLLGITILIIEVFNIREISDLMNESMFG